MEEDQNEQNVPVTEQSNVEEVHEEQPASSRVSFPTIGEPKKGNGGKTLLIIGILVLVGILGFVIYKSASQRSETVSEEPTPFENLTSPSGEENPVATPTPKPVDRSKVKIQIQNGTGITGEAAYLQTQLKGLGYTDVTVSNAAQQNATTTYVTFSNALSSDVVSEITKKLESLYQNVSTTNSATSSVSVLVVTGLRKGATPKPSATPVVTSTPTPTPTPQ
jgi:predicted negative regulator of RcsB-dependent stress response